MRIHALVFALLLAFILSGAPTLNTTAPVSGLEFVAQAQEQGARRATYLSGARLSRLSKERQAAHLHFRSALVIGLVTEEGSE